MEKNSNKKVLKRLVDVEKIFSNIDDNKLSNTLPMFMSAKIYAIIDKMLSKTFFKSKKNIAELPYNLKKTYDHIKYQNKNVPSDIKEGIKEVLRRSKEAEKILSIKELKEKIKSNKN